MKFSDYDGPGEWVDAHPEACQEQITRILEEHGPRTCGEIESLLGLWFTRQVIAELIESGELERVPGDPEKCQITPLGRKYHARQRAEGGPTPSRRERRSKKRKRSW